MACAITSRRGIVPSDPSSATGTARDARRLDHRADTKLARTQRHTPQRCRVTRKTELARRQREHPSFRVEQQRPQIGRDGQIPLLDVTARGLVGSLRSLGTGPCYRKDVISMRSDLFTPSHREATASTRHGGANSKMLRVTLAGEMPAPALCVVSPRPSKVESYSVSR